MTSSLLHPMACSTVLLGMLTDQSLGQHRDMLLQLVRLQIAATGQPSGVLTITLRDITEAMQWNNNAAARRRLRQAIDAGHLRMAGAERCYQVMRLDLAFVGVYLHRARSLPQPSFDSTPDSTPAHANSTPAHPHRPPATMRDGTRAHANSTRAHAESTPAHANSTPAHPVRPMGGVGGGIPRSSSLPDDDDDERERISHIIIIMQDHGFDGTRQVHAIAALPHITPESIAAVCEHAQRHPGTRNWRGLALSILASPAQTDSILHPEPLKFSRAATPSVEDAIAAAAEDLRRREQM